MAKLQPAECTYDARDGEDGMTHVMIFPVDETHPLSDNLRSDDLDGLPDYFAEADAENYWMIDVPVGKVKEDLDAAGFTFKEEEDGAMDDYTDADEGEY